MMGGCFAQSADSQVVETYWPAHSVTLSETIVFKGKSDDLLLPFWCDGIRAGGRLENIHRGKATQYNILNWGEWDTVSGIRIADALYMGLGRGDKPDGAGAYAVCGNGGLDAIRSDYTIANNEECVPCLEVSAQDDYIWMKCPSGSRSGKVKQYPSPFTGQWQIRVRGPVAGVPFDVVSYWWKNARVHNKYFMVQPMKSTYENAAFFTHGYNILTEI